MTRSKPDMNLVLSQFPGMLIRINVADIERISKGEGIPAEIVFMAKDQAAKRGDELFEEDAREAGGEDKVPHGYISGLGEFWYGQLPAEVKSRRRAISGAASTPAGASSAK